MADIEIYFNRNKNINRGYRRLEVWKEAIELFAFVKKKLKILKDVSFKTKAQLEDSGLSVPSNIAEGYRKRRYPKHFTSKMTDADGEASETTVWLDFSKEFQYIDSEAHSALCSEYDEVGKMLGSMADNPEKFLPKNKMRG